MTSLYIFIKEIEDHTKQDFDFSNQRHKFHLNEKIKRMSSKYEGLKSKIKDVVSGYCTYDPKTQKAISKPRNT